MTRTAVQTLPSPFAVSQLMAKESGPPVALREISPRDVAVSLAHKASLDVNPKARLARDYYPDVTTGDYLAMGKPHACNLKGRKLGKGFPLLPLASVQAA